MLSIQLFGQPALLRDGRPLDLPRRKARALVFYLAAQDRPQTRDHLLAFFWPDLDRPGAQQTLRATLHALRTALGDALVADRDLLSLASDAEVDARLFQSRLSPLPADPDALAAALDLYRGDFLEGFALPDGDEFDDWLSAERERYRRLAVRALAALAAEHERRGRFSAALDALDRALVFDPFQEDLQRARIRLHYLAGDRPGAIRRYEELRKLLNRELGVSPMAETRTLYDAILADNLPALGVPAPTAPPARPKRPASPLPPAPDATLPFTGRDAELDFLRASLAGESRRLVLLESEPGSGKTRLAEEFIRRTDALPVVGVAHELEQALPYQPIIEGLRGLLSCPDWPALEADLRAGLAPVWRAELARLIPELSLSSAPLPRSLRTADEWRLWEGINQSFLALARRRPLILFLDDLHWADASTLGLLGYLVRQAASAPVFFLAAARPFSPRSPLAALLQALAREDRLVRLSLPRLSTADVTAIARRLSPDFAYPLGHWLTRISEGNPYVLAELVRYTRENGLLLPDGTVNLSALSDSPVVPRTIYGLVQSRLRRLSEAARRVLDVAAALGREFEFPVVARAAALSDEAALDALDELRAEGLIRPLDGSRYAFDHSLTMEVTHREMSEPRRRLLHRRVAEALESVYHRDLDAVAGMLAWHFAEGDDPARAAPYAFRAGRHAARLTAWTEAAAFYEQALAATSGVGRLPILMALGDARLQAGQAVPASDAFHEALDLARSLGDPAALDAARLALARSFLSQSRFAEATALTREVLDSGLPENALHAEFLWGTVLSLEGADLAGAAEHLRAADTLCPRRASAGASLLAHVKFELGSVAAQQGNLPEAIALYREALRVAREADDPDAALTQLVLAHNNLAYHLHLLHDPAALDYASEGLRLAQEKGLLGLQTYLLSTLGEIALARGDLDAAEARFEEGLAIAERLAIPERLAGLTANLGLVAIQRGDSATAIRRLTAALERADALGTRHLAAQIRLWLVPLLPPAEARLRLAEARAIAESGGRLLLLDQVARLESSLPAPP